MGDGDGPNRDYLHTKRGRFYLLVDRPIPTKSTGQVGLNARRSYSELRGKLVLGLGASSEAVPFTAQGLSY
jgi:hypothetical protein